MTGGSVETLIKKQLAQYHLFREHLAETRAEGGPRHAPVVTISRMTGCCARSVSEILAARLDLQVWKPDLIDLVAKDHQLMREVAAVLDGETLGRIDSEVEAMVKHRRCRDDKQIQNLVRVVKILAEGGGVVIHGRGGALIMGDKADLRMRLVAGEHHRLRTVMERRQVSERKAGILMRAGDSKRATFVRLALFSDIDNARYYDLILNTDRSTPEEVVDLAVCWLELKGHKVD